MAVVEPERSQWRQREVADLINIWGDSSIQAKLVGSYRNRAILDIFIFDCISREMAERGYERSWIQCQGKIKSLRAKYEAAKDAKSVSCPFYDELDRVLGEEPCVQPAEPVGSCFTGDEPGERSPRPAASTGSSESGDAGDGTPASTSEESSTSRTDGTSFNSSASSTITGSRSAKKRKRKSTLEETLEVFADKICTALKNEEDDLLLKMQAAQHDHERKMFSMLTQFLERSSRPPQPPFYRAPTQPSLPSQLYRPREHPHPHPHASPFPGVSGPSNVKPVYFLQDLHQPLLFNNAHPHSYNVTQAFFQTPVNTLDYPPAFQAQRDDEMSTSLKPL